MELSDEEIERLSYGGDNRDSDDDRGARSDEAEEEPSTRKDNDDDDNDEETKKRVDPSTSKKRIIKNPQPKLNAERIQGPKGVHTIEKYFEGFKFHGKGHEKSDLDRVMKRLEHWAHRLFPKYRFDDFIEKIEVLGTKKGVQVFLKKYRLGMVTADEDIIEGAEEGEPERAEEATEQAPVDEFDKLIAEQIEKQRANEKTSDASTTSSGNVLGSASVAKTSGLSDEIKARIEANRKLAIERKMARAKRLEAESLREKLEESREKLDESRENYQTTISPIHEEVPDYLEKSQDTESTRSKRQKLEETQEDYQMLATRSQHQEDPVESLNLPAEKSPCTESTEISLLDSRANGVPNLYKDSKEPNGSSERSVSEVEEAMDTSTKAGEMEEVSERREQTNLPQTQKQNLENPTDDVERLLTREELLMAIDGAMEEIIGRKETLENIVL